MNKGLKEKVSIVLLKFFYLLFLIYKKFIKMDFCLAQHIHVLKEVIYPFRLKRVSCIERGYVSIQNKESVMVHRCLFGMTNIVARICETIFVFFIFNFEHLFESCQVQCQYWIQIKHYVKLSSYKQHMLSSSTPPPPSLSFSKKIK